MRNGLELCRDAKTLFHPPSHFAPIRRLDHGFEINPPTTLQVSLLSPSTLLYSNSDSFIFIKTSQRSLPIDSIRMDGCSTPTHREIPHFLSIPRTFLSLPFSLSKGKLIPTFLFVVSSRVVRYSYYNLVRVGFIQRRKHWNLGKSLDRQSK